MAKVGERDGVRGGCVCGGGRGGRGGMEREARS